MTVRRNWTSGLVAIGVAVIFLLVDTYSASAQSLRYWGRTVDAGKQIEFQWLNFDQRTCKDNGYAKFIVETAPKLGRFRTQKRKFTQQNGPCKGQRFSVLLVYYVAGRTKGNDSPAFTIQGSNNIRINLNIQVK